MRRVGIALAFVAMVGCGSERPSVCADAPMAVVGGFAARSDGTDAVRADPRFLCTQYADRIICADQSHDPGGQVIVTFLLDVRKLSSPPFVLGEGLEIGDVVVSSTRLAGPMERWGGSLTITPNTFGYAIHGTACVGGTTIVFNSVTASRLDPTPSG